MRRRKIRPLSPLLEKMSANHFKTIFGQRLPNGSGGFSYIEVLVAVVIAAFVSLGLYASAIYTMRETARDIDHLYALQIANSAAAKVRAGNFSKMRGDVDDLTSDDFEYQFFQTHTITADSAGRPANTYTLKYQLKGFGKGIKKNPTWTVLDMPASSAEIQANELQGHLLVVTGGAGANEVRAITKNQKSKTKKGVQSVRVKQTKSLDKKSGDWNDDWNGVDSSSVFTIDYGLYCEVTVSWDDGAGYKTIKEIVYVPSD